MTGDEGSPAAADARAWTEPGEGGLRRTVLTHPRGGRAEVYAHGAHVARWAHLDAGEVLYLSPRARFAPGAAIRGGVPVIFPQFAGLGPLPRHGFARTAEWELVDATASAAAAAASVRLRLDDSPATRAVWPHPFRAELTVTLDDALTIALAVANTGAEPFDFTCALHGYYRVADVRRAALTGLGGTRFHDKVEDDDKTASGDELRFAGETDRVYAAAPDVLRLRDEAGGRTLTLEKRGFPDTVVWTPWAEAAGAIDDLPGGDWARFVCIEPAHAAAALTLAPGARWQGAQTLRIIS